MNRTVMAGSLLVMALLACGQPAEEWQSRGWTVTPSPFSPTQTPAIVQITTTPASTYTPIVKVVTETPLGSLCVSATVAVHLRPSPSDENHPVSTLLNGTVVEDLGGRDGVWWFVEYGELSGWVHSSYVVACNSTQE